MEKNIDRYLNNISFFNSSMKRISFIDVFSNILSFVKHDPRGIYTLAIGTDSQVKTDCTVFISAIMIYRKGEGAWGCMSRYRTARRIMNIREKISIETFLTQQIACMFNPKILDEIINIILPYIDYGAEFHHEVHIDIGNNGSSKRLINEMTSYFAGMGFEPKIKPDSYVASSYANRYTK